MTKLRPKHVLGGLVGEAWARSMGSYSRSLEMYKVRVADATQPSFPLINVFDVKTNNLLIWTMNFIYILVTAAIFLYMKRRSKGFRLRWLLCVYDALNVVLAAYISLQTLKYKLGHSGLLLCNPISIDAEGYNIARVFVLFYMQKYLEFFDTWFFLLRKSSRQVTFLHLFHHSSITVVVGSILPFDYNGDMYLPIMLNSANHMLVYLHYLLATLGLNSWWAPYITSLQLAQFIIIFGQSLLSYRVGPTCGSPDFAKLLIIVYMGSMVALFGNFFLQRYIFRRPYTALDLCGVVKSPSPIGGLIVSAQHCGIATLNAQGSCIVLLPPEFPDPVWAESSSSRNKRQSFEQMHHPDNQSNHTNNDDSHPTPCPYAPFTVAYHLTPIGCAMPNLYVATELTKFKTSVWQSLLVSSSTSSSSSSQRNSNKVDRATSSTSTSSSSSSSGGGMNVTGKVKTTNVSRKVSIDPSSVNRQEESSIHDNIRSRSAESKSKDLMEQEMAILRSYWAATSVEKQLHSGRPVKIGRSVSTGNLPEYHSSSLRPAISSDSFLNDRLIDGPLPIPLLGAALGANSATMCQLDRGIENDGESTSATTFSTISETTDINNRGKHVGTSATMNSNKDCYVGGIIPLCFAISGGVPGGRISWMVTTLPRSVASDNAVNSFAFAENDFALGSSASPTYTGNGNFDNDVGNGSNRNKGRGHLQQRNSHISPTLSPMPTSNVTKDWREL